MTAPVCIAPRAHALNACIFSLSAFVGTSALATSRPQFGRSLLVTAHTYEARSAIHFTERPNHNAATLRLAKPQSI